MFQRMSKLYCHRLLFQNYQAINRSYGDVASTAYVAPKEINRVWLVGTIVEENRNTNIGQQFCIKTFNDQHNYCIHDIVVKNQKLRDIIIQNGLKKGQRVSINGRFSTPNDNTGERKAHIIAGQINLTDSMVDENSVEYMGAVINTVKNDLTQSTFLISNNYTTAKSGSGKEFEANAVMVTGNELALHTARNLKKHNRVYLNGTISYSDAIDKQGQSYGRGSIMCNYIIHLSKYSKEGVSNAEVEEEASQLW